MGRTAASGNVPPAPNISLCYRSIETQSGLICTDPLLLASIPMPRPEHPCAQGPISVAKVQLAATHDPLILELLIALRSRDLSGAFDRISALIPGHDQGRA